MKRRPPCPTPEKSVYANEKEARLGAKLTLRITIQDGQHADPLYGYLCTCKRWHLTRRAVWDGEPQILLAAVPDDLQRWAGVTM